MKKIIQALILSQIVLLMGCASGGRATSNFFGGFSRGFNGSQQSQSAPSRPINCVTSGETGLYTTSCN